jgi:RNA-binding protein YhbY
MCQTVIFAKSGIECKTVKELKLALPKIELIKNEMYKEIQDDGCLCQIDLDDTFDKAGLDWECDYMQFTLNDL